MSQKGTVRAVRFNNR